MTKKSFASYFGLVILALSLFASTAFAVNTAGPGTTQVVVTNSPAQPVPMVGVVKDADAPARKPFQSLIIVAGSNQRGTIVSVPANQRFVVEHVSGHCAYLSGSSSNYVYLFAEDPNTHYTLGQELLPGEILTGTISSPVRFYADPGTSVFFYPVDSGNSGSCALTVSGYFVNLP